MSTTPLTDGFGRTHRSLRLSVTDRCNLRCRYCMPAEGMKWLPREELLSDDELIRMVRLFAAHGDQRDPRHRRRAARAPGAARR